MHSWPAAALLRSVPACAARHAAETMENADKCAWQFGDVRTDAQGRISNVMVGGQPYLIQANWNPATDVTTGYQIGCVINA